MSIEPIKIEVRRLLAQAKEDIRQAERTLVGEDLVARVRAAGQLVFLKHHKAELEARAGDLNRSSDGAARTVLQWIKEDWMILMQRLESWIEAR